MVEILRAFHKPSGTKFYICMNDNVNRLYASFTKHLSKNWTVWTRIIEGLVLKRPTWYFLLIVWETEINIWNERNNEMNMHSLEHFMLLWLFLFRTMSIDEQDVFLLLLSVVFYRLNCMLQAPFIFRNMYAWDTAS